MRPTVATSERDVRAKKETTPANLLTPFNASLVGVEASSSSFGDLDGDGNLDLVITGQDESSDAITNVYLGDGGGGFTEANAGLVNVAHGSSSLGDIDGDGNLDVVLTGADAQGRLTTAVYLGDGNGGFTEANAGLTGVNVSSSALADLNEDGHLDLLVTGLDENLTSAARVYLGDGEGGFTEANADLRGVEFSSSSIGDIDGDGHLDLLLVGADASSDSWATVYLGDGSGGFTEANAGLAGVNSGSTSIADLDEDGNLDLVITGQDENGDPTAVLYLGDGKGGFTQANAGLTAVASSTSSIADLDGDGNLDVLISGTDENLDRTTTLYLGDGTGNFTEADAGLTVVSRGSSALGDVDGDGHLDVLVSGGKERETNTTLYENLSDGDFRMASSSVTVDGDGTVDFGDTGASVTFSGTSGSGTVRVQRFSNAPSLPHGIRVQNVSDYRFVISAAGDLTFDDNTEVRLDVGTLAGVGNASNVTVYSRRPRGAGLFTERSTSYDSGADVLVASTGSFGEYALGSEEEPLPVALADFEATVDEDKVHLRWQTTSERGNARFEIQRQVGRQNAAQTSGWTEVGSVTGGGTTTEAQSYRFTDADLPYEASLLTYRLRQVDTDGTTHFSKPISLERPVHEVTLLGTYPNPARNQATVRFAVPERQDVTLRMSDLLGREVRTLLRDRLDGRYERTVDLSGLPSGTYFLQLTTETASETKRFTVVR